MQTTLTQENIQKARDYFAANDLACIAEAVQRPDTLGAVPPAGKWFVNDYADYCAWCMQRRADALAGKNDHTFTFLQMAHYFQTGEMRALLA